MANRDSVNRISRALEVIDKQMTELRKVAGDLQREEETKEELQERLEQEIHPEAVPPWDDLDPEIVPLVRLLHIHGFEMFSSCQGGDGHHFKDPTVIVWERWHDVIKTGQEITKVMIMAGYRDFDISLMTSHRNSMKHWPIEGPPSVMVELWTLNSIPGRQEKT